MSFKNEMHKFDVNNTLMVGTGMDNCYNGTHLVIGHQIYYDWLPWCFEEQKKWGNL